MLTPQFVLPLAGEIMVDLFAGGGGWSSAFETATGQPPHVAINHDADAISMHEMNHPQSKHYQADIYEVCPHEATGGILVVNGATCATRCIRSLPKTDWHW